jgi:putative membrane protein
MYDWNGAGHMNGMWFFWIVGILIVLALVWAVFRTSSQTSKNSGDSAEQLLKRRYANGEIEKDEYEKRLHDLRL